MNRLFSKKLLFGLLFLSAVISVQAQHVDELYSPYFFGVGPQSASLEAPTATIFNPAAAALEQRTKLSVGYIRLFDINNTGSGTSLNLGISLPSTIGVFSIEGGYIGSDLSTANIGQLGNVHFAFSKALAPNFLIGLGISGIFGTLPDSSPDWGLAADLGIIHIIGDLLFIKEFTWGLVMRNMGKAYGPQDNRYLPKIFTPAVSTTMDLVKTKPFTWSLSADLSFPTFSNLVLYASTGFDLFEVVDINASFNMDVDEIVNSPAQRFPVTFGLTVKFKIDLESSEFLSGKGWAQNDLKVDAAFAPLSDGAFAVGAGVTASLGMKDSNPPKVKIEPVKPEGQPEEYDEVYVSPNLDGTQDNLELKINITDERYIKGFKLIIKDEAGNEVRVIENKESRPENIKLDNVFDRLLYVEKGILVPESVSWDGKNETGTVVGDGSYTYVIEAWDDNGNTSTTELQKVVIDTKEPEIEIDSDYTIFSPNDDGNKDTLPLKFNSSQEDNWKAEITDEDGNVVSTVEWSGKPQDFEWGGKDSSGALLPDGIYSIAVSSTDRAGNTATKSFENIIINTEETPIFLTVDKTIFSPNGDSNADSVYINIILGNPDGIKSWKLEMIHQTDGTEKTFTGGSQVKNEIVWDGTADNGKTAAQGMYNAQLTVEYVKGDVPVESSKAFRLDLTAPAVELSFSPSPFSPDNDGIEDELSILTSIDELSGIGEWHMEVLDPAGNHFTSFSGKGKPSAAIIWDGISDTGELVQAASDYKLILEIEDSVGNATTVQKTISVDVLVIRDGDKLYIRVPSITFKPNTANYKDVAAEALEKNMWTLERLAGIFKKYQTYKIQIEGHAVSVYYEDPEKAAKEQTEELIPLSKSRAEAIKTALVALGIEAGRISTVGVGADRPIVPFSDKVNRWKDRRVEFILIK